MTQKMAPTRGNLVQARKAYAVAKTGKDLLEQKRQVLMMELVGQIESAREIQADVSRVFDTAYRALQRANTSIGIDMVEAIAMAIPEEDSLTVRLRSIMGVEIPEIDPLPRDIRPCYSFWQTSGSMDNAFKEFKGVLALLLRLAEIETSVYRLAVQIRRTHRRVNALEKVVIPFYQDAMAVIDALLEEQEREDFVRMKIAKKMSERKR
ncbi:MAG: V-type ATP synthase subunit D [Thermovirgaceae bacterium]|nr:V-type ATP synthase subunit D [Thermovirgaceae bacterium]